MKKRVATLRMILGSALLCLCAGVGLARAEAEFPVTEIPAVGGIPATLVSFQGQSLCGLDVRGNFDVQFLQVDDPSATEVKMEIDSLLLSHLVCERDTAGVLRLDLRGLTTSHLNRMEAPRPKVWVKINRLTSLRMGGSATLIAATACSTPGTFTMKLSGFSAVSLSELRADDAEIELTDFAELKSAKLVIPGKLTCVQGRASKLRAILEGLDQATLYLRGLSTAVLAGNAARLQFRLQESASAEMGQCTVQQTVGRLSGLTRLTVRVASSGAVEQSGTANFTNTGTGKVELRKL